MNGPLLQALSAALAFGNASESNQSNSSPTSQDRSRVEIGISVSVRPVFKLDRSTQGCRPNSAGEGFCLVTNMPEGAVVVRPEKNGSLGGSISGRADDPIPIIMLITPL